MCVETIIDKLVLKTQQHASLFILSDERDVSEVTKIK